MLSLLIVLKYHPMPTSHQLIAYPETDPMKCFKQIISCILNWRRMFKKFTQHRYKKNPCKSLVHYNYKMCRSFPFYFWKSKYDFLSKGGNIFVRTILALKNNLFLTIFVDCNLEIQMHYDILRLMKLMKVRKTITFL